MKLTKGIYGYKIRFKNISLLLFTRKVMSMTPMYSLNRFSRYQKRNKGFVLTLWPIELWYTDCRYKRSIV